MKKTCFIAAFVILCAQSQAFSQSEELPKFEVAAEFTTLEREAFNRRTEPGIGGRFTYNLNEFFSLEAAGYFFPKRCNSCRENGHVTEVLGGVKVGKRFDSWGIFAKARPGVVSFSEGAFNILRVPASPFDAVEFERTRVTSFATDFGGVVEFYPSKHLVTRFDAGDTIIRFTRQTTNGLLFNPLTQTFTLTPITSPARTSHNFQFMASVGFRF